MYLNIRHGGREEKAKKEVKEEMTGKRTKEIDSRT